MRYATTAEMDREQVLATVSQGIPIELPILQSAVGGMDRAERYERTIMALADLIRADKVRAIVTEPTEPRFQMML